jgi:hypothetical protein
MWRFAFHHLAAHHDPVEAGVRIRRHALRLVTIQGCKVTLHEAGASIVGGWGSEESRHNQIVYDRRRGVRRVSGRRVQRTLEYAQIFV